MRNSPKPAKGRWMGPKPDDWPRGRFQEAFTPFPASAGYPLLIREEGMILAMLRSSVQFLIRLLLGAVLLPVLCSAFLLLSVIALCSDKQLLRLRGVRSE